MADIEPQDFQAVAEQLIAEERVRLHELHITPLVEWEDPFRSRGASTSRESFELMTRMPGAAHALALLRSYATTVGLTWAERTWSISAIPKTVRAGYYGTFSTISSAQKELFWVLLDPGSGDVAGWGVTIDGGIQAPRGAAGSTREFSGGADALAEWLAFVSKPEQGDLVRRTRVHRQQKRYDRWHNEWLAHHVLAAASRVGVAERLVGGAGPMNPDTGESWWMVPNNVALFDAESALRKHSEILWSQRGNSMRVGDKVFLRATGEAAGLTHALVIVEVEVPTIAGDPTEAYWLDRTGWDERDGTRWMRLRLVHTLTSAERASLSLANLRAAKGPGAAQDTFQSRERLRGDLLHLVERVMASAWVGEMSDAVAEAGDFDPVEEFRFAEQLDSGKFAVPDRYNSAKTRGSAQRAFAAAIKENYGGRCAVSGISTPEFLVASHIVPWAADEATRLDPTNGICLSTLIDRAFDTGFLRITPEAVVEVDRQRLAEDPHLEALLGCYDGKALRAPTTAPPAREYLRRRYQEGTATPGPVL